MDPTTINGCYFRALGRHDDEDIKYWSSKLTVDAKSLDTIHRMGLLALEELLVELGMRKVKASEMAKMHRKLRGLGFDFGMLELQRVWEAAARHEEDSRVSEDQALRIRMSLFRYLSEDHGVAPEALDAAIVRAEDRLWA